MSASDLDGSNGFVIHGVNPADLLGVSVASAGDLNVDGIPDIVIGSRRTDGISGGAYVVFGAAGIGKNGELSLDELNGTNGFRIAGDAVAVDLGNALSSVGDINNDGIDDIILGARFAAPNGLFSAGACYVIFGSLDVGGMGLLGVSSLDGSNGFAIYGEFQNDLAGYSVSGGEDFNGDGVDDLIIGATHYNPYVNGSGYPYGTCYIVYGSGSIGGSGVLELGSLDWRAGSQFVLPTAGGHYKNYFGESVSMIGDVNSDGYADALVSFVTSQGASPQNGARAAYILFGRAEVGSSGYVDLVELDDSLKYLLRTIGHSLPNLRGGQLSPHRRLIVSRAGDLNNDGIQDMILGAIDNGYGGSTSAGAYVLFGGSSFTVPADFNQNGCIDSPDLAFFLAAWGTPGADLNDDGTTDSADLAILLAAWTG